MALQVEIAICTWNRSELLRRTLSRFLELRSHWDKASDCDWKLIVVDNRSTDSTSQLLSEFQTKLPLHLGQEKTQGHTFARNKAIELATGDLMIWTDDDVIVDDNWLPTYVQAAFSQPNIDFWGSKIVPKFFDTEKTPSWILENWQKLKGCFAERDLGDSPRAFSVQDLPYGANFAVRTDVQKKFTFRSDLGRTNNAIVGDDEIDTLRRIIEAGHRGTWIPNAAVEHLIDPSRQTTEYVAKYFEGQGRALVARNEPWTTDIDSLQAESRHELFWSKIKRYFCHSDVWVSHLIRGSLAKGQWQAMSEQPNRN